MDSLKILHRIYFGFDGKVDLYQEYLKTWEEQLPDYKIIHWNADNLPIDICEYTRELFKEKDHAYLSDYFRWWVLREYGGIYLDADIEIINGEKFNILVEELENTSEYHSFIGIELLKSKTYTAHSMACKKKSPLTQYMCSLYENMGEFSKIRHEWVFCATQLPHLYFINHLSTHKKNRLASNGWIEVIDNPIICGEVKIYPQSYFSPLDQIGTNYYINETWENIWGLTQVSPQSCICHHFSNSYLKNMIPSSSRKNIYYQDYLNLYKNNTQENIITEQQLLKIYFIFKNVINKLLPHGSFLQKICTKLANIIFKILRKSYRILKYIYHSIKKK